MKRNETVGGILEDGGNVIFETELKIGGLHL